MDAFPSHVISQFVLSWMRALKMSYLDYTINLSMFFLALCLKVYQQNSRVYPNLHVR